MRIKLMQGRYRLIHEDGKIVKNENNTPSDNGGYRTKEEGEKALSLIEKTNSDKGKEVKPPMLLNYAGSITPVSPLTVDDNNISTRRYKKDIISIGQFIHPKQGWSLNVDQDMLSKFVNTFNSMKKNGVDVEVVKDHSQKAEDVIGYVEDIFVEGDKLSAVVEVIGQGSIDLVERVKNVSVTIENFKDGKGNSYGEAITNVSVVQQPVVAGQDKFKRIAASLISKEPDMDLTKISKALGIEIPEATAEDAIIGAFNKLKDQLGSVTKDLSLKSNTIDPNLLEQMGKTAEAKLELSVVTGKLSPATSAQMKALFIGEPGKRNPMSLSICGENESVFDKILSLLTSNVPVTTGNKAPVSVPNTKSGSSGIEDVTKTMLSMIQPQ